MFAGTKCKTKMCVPRNTANNTAVMRCQIHAQTPWGFADDIDAIGFSRKT
jgi:hypothetical protein